MFWRVLIGFLTDIISLKVEELSLKELCTQVRQTDESLPDWVWADFFPTVLKDFGKVPGDIFVKIKLIQKSSKEYLSRNYVHMYDLSFFDLFLGKGFPSCKGEKTSKKIHVNDVLGYSLFFN